MVQLAGACDADAPRLVAHADTTPANVHEVMRTAPIQDALAANGLAPSEHLVDAGCVSAGHLVAAGRRHGIDPIGPARPDQSWQKQEKGAYRVSDFAVDRERRHVRCPEGHESTSWGEYRDKATDRPYIRAEFSPAACWACSADWHCTRVASRRLALHPRPEHDAIATA